MPVPRSDNDAFAIASKLWQIGQVAQAEAILCELAVRLPRREDVAWLLAEVLRNQGRLDAAARTVLAFCQARGFDHEASLRGAKFAQQCQRQQIADELCKSAIARDNVSPELWAVAGNVARELGDFERSRSCYLTALDAGVDLNTTFVLGALAHTMRYTDPGHPDLARFAGHFRNGAFSARARAATGFGLAKAYDDIADFKSSAKVLREANALVRSVQPWNPTAWRQFVASRKQARVAGLRGEGFAGFVPVFVVGLPRTGTTLTATRLAGHIGGRDRGELRTLQFIAQRLIEGNHLVDVAAIGEAAQLYYMHSRQDDAPALHYIDQDPLNFRYLDIVAAMFPQARIIHCRRDSGDTALSLWRQDFAHPDCGFAYDFASIADYMAAHDELMSHWQQVLALPILTVQYEKFVADPQRVLAELQKYIGASAEVGRFDSMVIPINTSSVWQARQPIYMSSVGRARAYTPFVPELAQFVP